MNDIVAKHLPNEVTVCHIDHTGKLGKPVVYIPARHLDIYHDLVRHARALVSGVEAGTATVTPLEQLGDDLDRLDALVVPEASR